jgi:ABC-type transport system substrate-binding protein
MGGALVGILAGPLPVTNGLLRLKEPFVWLIETLAVPAGMWIIAPEVVDKFGDLKKPESAIGTGPFMLEHYEPNVKAVFMRNPDYFDQNTQWEPQNVNFAENER